MNFPRMALLVAASSTLLAAGGCLMPIKTSEKETASAAADRSALASAAIGEWSETSALAARRLIDEYGVPDEVHYDRLVWGGRGPWRRTVVRNVRPFYVQDSDLAVVEQTIDYSLTPTQVSWVSTAFGDRVRFNPRTQELSARSDREEDNYLRLNLAHDVAGGTLSPEAARRSYTEIVSFEESGKTSPYLLGLRFK
jgi:hypothetical protein